MKRVFLLCMVGILMISGIAKAKVLKSTDSFTGGVTMSSSIHPESLIDRLYFKRNFSENKYLLLLGAIQLKEYSLKRAFVEIKIDEFPIQELEVYA